MEDILFSAFTHGCAGGLALWIHIAMQRNHANKWRASVADKLGDVVDAHRCTITRKGDRIIINDFEELVRNRPKGS